MTPRALAPSRSPVVPPAWPSRRRAAGLLAGVAAAVAFGTAAEADEPAPTQTVVVVGTTILPGAGTPIDQVSANVQTLTGGEFETRRALDLSAGLNQALGSVNVNDTAGNPFQMDVNFRGFTASPALGTPQGLSVFVDGVRVNEVFGDTVNWDLIPAAAIDQVTVMPGSNPVFGLNTLGGALNVGTKSGRSDPGTEIEVQGGSFGRRALQVQTGAQRGAFDTFLSGSDVVDGGWGEHNPSHVRQAFGKLGWHAGGSAVDLSLSLADNRMEGNQTLPLSMMDDLRQSYSWPDTQRNRMVFVNLKASRRLTEQWLIEGDLYHRAVDTHAFNSNVNNNFDPALPVGPGNQPTGNAINQIDQSRPGASVQLSSLAALAGHRNQFVVGASVDSGRTDFTQSNQEAGSSRDTSSTQPVVLATSLHSQATATGVYAEDTFGLTPRTFLNLSGRFNRATVRLEDQLGTALNGDHAFQRLNPALGLTYNPAPTLTTYASYNEGMRVPTPVELSCADPTAPCSLPNAFSSDPALKPVISRTWELGARGRVAPGWAWSAAVFRTELDDDIQFISSGGGATSAGYFQNVGRTRRQGVELGLERKTGPLRLSAHYSLIDATFQTPLRLNSPSNSTAAPLACPTCTDIQVQPGNRMPGQPRQIAKLRAEWRIADRGSLGLNLMAQSRQYARGDENNQDVNGPLPGYALFHLDARWHLRPGLSLFAKVDNLFDRRYASFGTLGQNVFTAPGHQFDPSGATWRNEQFRTVGAPRGVWLGLSYRFGDAAAGG